MTTLALQGLVLGNFRFGESGKILSLFTREHGRVAAVVHGRMGVPGSLVTTQWRRRTLEQIGTFSAIELLAPSFFPLLRNLNLYAFQSLLSLLPLVIAEQDPHPDLFDLLENSLKSLPRSSWYEVYIPFEIQLLKSLGLGLDLSECAVTGRREGLAYLSPASGRAVTVEGAGAWADRLFPLPKAFFCEPVREEEVNMCLEITGHFLRKHTPHLPQVRSLLKT